MHQMRGSPEFEPRTHLFFMFHICHIYSNYMFRSLLADSVGGKHGGGLHHMTKKPRIHIETLIYEFGFKFHDVEPKLANVMTA